MSKKLLFGFIFLSFLVIAPSVFAQGQSQIKGNRPSPKPSPVTALNEVRLKSCEAKQMAIGNRMNNLIRMTENMYRAFGSITDRVKAFYTEKVIPRGRVVANYNELVADVDAKKVLVNTALDAAKADSVAFDCASEEDPKARLSKFGQDMRNVKSALKNYRTSIKNLILAVKRGAPKESPQPSASSAAISTTSPSPTAVPTATPTAAATP